MSGNTDTDAEQSVEALSAEVARLKKEHRQFKAGAYQVALDYKKKNRWCDEYDRLLKDAGLTPKYETVAVEMMISAGAIFSVNTEVWEDLTEQERVDLITRSCDIKPASLGPNGVVGQGSIRFGTPSSVTVIEHRTPDRPVLPGWDWKYTSSQGIVLHLFKTEETHGYHDSLCDRVWGDPRTMCEAATRGEERLCVTCAKRVAER